MSVLLGGDLLAIEFRDNRPRILAELTPGQVDWVEPSDQIHRAVNAGRQAYEEITVFFLHHPDDVPQPRYE